MKTKQPQPNFETIKRIIYQKAVNSDDLTMCLLGCNRVKYNFNRNGLNYSLVGMEAKQERFRKEINDFLDSLDIRYVDYLKDEIKELLPKWYKDKKYVIDYNENGHLDFIRL